MIRAIRVPNIGENDFDRLEEMTDKILHGLCKCFATLDEKDEEIWNFTVVHYDLHGDYHEKFKKALTEASYSHFDMKLVPV